METLDMENDDDCPQAQRFEMVSDDELAESALCVGSFLHGWMWKRSDGQTFFQHNAKEIVEDRLQHRASLVFVADGQA